MNDKKTFKAFRVEEENEKFVSAIKEMPFEVIEEGEVLIKVHYSSLNYKDALSSVGNKGVTRNYPHTPGIDAVGTIVTSTAKKFKVGDEVIVTSYDLGMNTNGGFAEYVKAPEVTKRRVYLETLQDVLPKLGNKIVTDSEGTQALPLLQMKIK